MRAPDAARIALLVLLGAIASWGLWILSQRVPDGSRLTTTVVPQRAILFAPNLTETAFVLGHGERVVGVTDYCVWPAAALALPKVGGMLEANFERIAALSPDLLIVQGQSEALRNFATGQQLELASVKMDDDIDSILRGISTVDSLLAGTTAPAVLAGIRTELRRVRQQAPTRRPRVLIVLGREPGVLKSLYTVGRGSFLNELVEIAGGEPQFVDHPRTYFNLSLETLLADPPDIALEIRPGEELDESAREAVAAPWRASGLDVRVAIVTFDGAMIPGPRIAETARHFQAAIHPDLPRERN